MPPLTVADVRLTETEFVRLSLRFSRRPIWILYGILGLVFLYFFISSTEESDLATKLATAGLWGILLLFAHWSGRQKMRKMYCNSPLLQIPATYHFTADGIATSTALNASHILWANVREVKQAGPWHYVATSSASGFLLDSRCVLSPYTSTDLDATLAQRGANLSTDLTLRPDLSTVRDNQGIFIPNVRPTLLEYLWLSLRMSRRLYPMTLFPLLLFLGLVILGLGVVAAGLITASEIWALNKKEILIVFTLAIGVPLLTIFLSWRQYRKSPTFQHLTNYFLTSEGMSLKSAVASAETNWAAFVDAHRLGPWLLLQTLMGFGYIIDTRCIAFPATVADVYALLQAQRITIK